MSSFTTPLIVESLGNMKFKLVEEFEYYISDLMIGKSIIVPKGFITDFASIPRIFWSILDPIGKHGKAAIIHDYLYFSAKVSRKEADIIFKQGMAVLGVSKWKIFVMYKAVRLFGWKRWNELRYCCICRK